MAKPIKIWSGSEWVDVAIQAPSTSGLATTSALAAHESDTTNIHGISDTANLIDKTIINAKGDLLVGSADNTVAKQAVGNNGQILMADSSATNGIRYVDIETNKNKVINGSMSVWARGTSITGSNNYTVDRFKAIGIGTVAWTVSRQSANLEGFQYCARVQRNSGDTGMTYLAFSTALETSDVIPMQGKVVTLSFYARAGANLSDTTLVFQLNTGTGIDQGPFTVHTGETTIISSSSVALTTTWQRFIFNGTIPSNATSMRIEWGFNPTGTAGAADFFEITGVQLEMSPVPTPFEFEPHETTLRKCQRYYQRIGATATFPYSIFAPSGIATTTTGGICYIPFKTTMRAIPSSIEYGGNLAVDTTTALVAMTSATVSDRCNSDIGAFVFATSGGLTTNTFATVRANNSSSAYLAFNAEL